MSLCQLRVQSPTRRSSHPRSFVFKHPMEYPAFRYAGFSIGRFVYLPTRGVAVPGSRALDDRRMPVEELSKQSNITLL